MLAPEEVFYRTNLPNENPVCYRSTVTRPFAAKRVETKPESFFARNLQPQYAYHIGGGYPALLWKHHWR